MTQKVLSHLILGKDYDQQNYSPSFHNMLSRAVTKIYSMKKRKKMLRTNVVSATFQEQQEIPQKTHFGFFANRKNSPNRTAIKFFSTPRNTQPQLATWIENPSLKSIPKFQTASKHTHLQGRNFRCNTDPMHSFKVKLHQKIEENNRCLKVNSYKCQEKSRLDVGLEQMLSKDNLVQTTKTCRPAIKSKRAYNHCEFRGHRVADLKGMITPRSTSLPITFSNDFRPWETKQGDQQLFF